MSISPSPQPTSNKEVCLSRCLNFEILHLGKAYLRLQSQHVHMMMLALCFPLNQVQVCALAIFVIENLFNRIRFSYKVNLIVRDNIFSWPWSGVII